MRIRSIKPEFWRSSDISELAVEDRLLFIGLWSYVDDNGVGVDKLSAITADLFADDLERDPRDTFARVSRGLQHLSEAGRIIRYTVENYDYIEIVNWTKHQRIDRPNKPRLPQYDAAKSTIRDTLDEHSRDTRETPSTGTGEQGNRGTGEQVTIAQITSTTENTTTPPRTSRASDDAHNTDERFALFWDTYPIKRDKKRAHKAFMKALNRADMDTIMAGAKQYRDDPNREIAFTKYAEGWLNGDGWDDDPLPPRTTTSTDQRRTENLNRLANYQPWDPDHQQPEQWGNPETRAIGH